MAIPELTTEQQHSLGAYIEGHRRDETFSLNPLKVARVLSGDKRGAYINAIREDRDRDPDEYLPPLFEALELPARKIDGIDGWNIARTEWRLDLLPTKQTLTDAYHRRCGVFYDYPHEAVEDFIETTIKVTKRDLVRAGVFDAEEVAYLAFVPYTYHNSVERYEMMIREGKKNRHRHSELAVVWDVPELENYADAIYQDFVAAYSGTGGTFSPPMMFPPDQNISLTDVEPLLS